MTSFPSQSTPEKTGTRTFTPLFEYVKTDFGGVFLYLSTVFGHKLVSLLLLIEHIDQKRSYSLKRVLSRYKTVESNQNRKESLNSCLMNRNAYSEGVSDRPQRSRSRADTVVPRLACGSAKPFLVNHTNNIP